MPPIHEMSPEMRQLFIDFDRGWMSPDGQAYLHANTATFTKIALYIRKHRQGLEAWCAARLNSSDDDELGYDTVAELICLEHAVATRRSPSSLT